MTQLYKVSLQTFHFLTFYIFQAQLIVVTQLLPFTWKTSALTHCIYTEHSFFYYLDLKKKNPTRKTLVQFTEESYGVFMFL